MVQIMEQHASITIIFSIILKTIFFIIGIL